MYWNSTTDAMPPCLAEGEHISIPILFAFAKEVPGSKRKIWHIFKGWFDYEKGEWEIDSCTKSFKSGTITHWMRIPPIEE